MGKKKNHEPNIQKGLMVLLSALYQVFCCSEKDFFCNPYSDPYFLQVFRYASVFIFTCRGNQNNIGEGSFELALQPHS